MEPTRVSISNLRSACAPCTITARVTYKTKIVPFKDSGKWGEIFLMYLLDESGEIVATCFNHLCHRYFHQIMEGKVYQFSGFDLQWPNKPYNLVPNIDFQIQFTDNTTAYIQPNYITIPLMKYNLKPLSQIANSPNMAPIDAIGVCVEVGDPVYRGDYLIREIVLENRGHYVILNLWNDSAENFDGERGNVILVKGTRLIEHNGTKRINFDWFSKMEINPDRDALKMCAF